MSTTTTDTTMYYVREDDYRDDLTRQEAEDLAVPELEVEVEQAYDDMLTEVYGPVSIIGLEYDAATVLRAVDPIAYRVGASDYQAQEYRELYAGDLPDAGECRCAIAEPCTCSAYDACTCAAVYLDSWHTSDCQASAPTTCPVSTTP